MLGIGLLWNFSPKMHGDGGNWAVHPDKICQITTGQTTKGNIRKVLGEPENIKQDTPMETWSYSRIAESFRFGLMTHGWTYKLDVIFDEGGIVVDFKYIVIEQEIFKKDIIKNLTHQLGCGSAIGSL